MARSWLQAVADATRAEVAAVCGTHEQVRDLVLRVLDDGAAQLSAPRLLAMGVAGAVSGDPDPALPVCVVSRLWWAGAQLLDDLADGAGGELPVGAAVLAGTLCAAGLPFAVIDRAPLAPHVAADWRRELLQTSMHAAAGQFADLSVADELGWAAAIASYRGKSGAPYGRDAVMAARLSTDDPVVLRGWRALGELFGVLRQLANDAAPDSVEEDLRNGTATARLALALDNAGPVDRERLLRLREAARHDPGARVAMLEALREPAVTTGYLQQVRAMREHATALLGTLAPPSRHRDFLQVLVHETARQAGLDRP